MEILPLLHKEVILLPAVAKLQVPGELLAPGNVISTKDSVPQLKTAVHPAAFRETPEPTGGGETKQPTRRRFIDLSTQCTN